MNEARAIVAKVLGVIAVLAALATLVAIVAVMRDSDPSARGMVGLFFVMPMAIGTAVLGLAALAIRPRRAVPTSCPHCGKLIS